MCIRDRSWIHHNNPETKHQSKRWTTKGKANPSAGKLVMAITFWDDCRIIFIDYLKKAKINDEYYANVIHLVNDKIKKKPHI